MRRLAAVIATLILAGLATLATAEDRPNTILVLDGSGSMWGQIDGVNKIVIAREVVGTVLDTFPEDQNLGLTVYGHRTRGDCADIETVVPPGAGTLGAIRAAVDGINPRGKTPMTDAVIAAAESLRYTEEAATVILVSDGIETCNPDPCAAARALEQAGIDFTAHVIGFDVTDPEALAQMQCLAEETGGTFRSASDAAELSEALTTVAAAPEPEPEPEPAVPVEVTFEARLDAEDGPLVDGPVVWTVTPRPEAMSAEETGNGLTIPMEQGSYEVTGYWVSQEAEARRQFIVTDDPRSVVLVFDTPMASATVTGPSTAVAGSTIEVGWTGPGGDLDYIGIGPVGADGADVAVNFSYARDGSPLDLLVPIGEGAYELRYIQQDGREVLAAAPITVTPVAATITAPSEATAGSTIEVGWTGPDYRNDYIGIGAVDAEGADAWENFTYTRDGSPLDLLVPTEPGDYLVTYFTDQDRVNIGQAAITVSAVGASITAPAQATAGSTIEVAWTGPDNANDYIGIGEVDADGADRWENFTYTRTGSPLDLLIPTEPGDYLVRYFLDQDRVVIAEVPISVSAVGATVSAPTEAIAGSTIEVTWTGPDNSNDYIGVGRVDADGADRWENFTYTRTGSPLDLLIPMEPGDYLIRYFLDQDRKVIAEASLTVTPVDATITAPPEATAGSTIEVAWTGPDYDNDYIGVSRAGDGRWDNFTYTRNGNPLELLMPIEPGDYEIHYFYDQDRIIGATIPISITPVTATLSAPAEAVAGATVTVEWTGPDYDNDYIGVSAEGEDRWDNFTYTRDGAPLKLVMPPAPGPHEIHYFTDQDRTILATIPVMLTPPEATLTAPDRAAPGSEIEVSWTGPDYDNDYVAINRADDDGWESFTYTREGSPLTITVPDAPGAYEVRYFMSQDRTLIAAVPLTVE